MLRRSIYPRLRLRLVCLAIAFSLLTVHGAASRPFQADEKLRKIWDTAFTSNKRRKKGSKRKYKVATPLILPVNVNEDTVVGVTVWRLRPLRTGDAGERLVTHDGSKSTKWIPERVKSNTQFRKGEFVRLSIEAARKGYLYVINREEYADGSHSEPYLIFPTTRIRAGHNEVKPGRVIEIPDRIDDPPYFTLRPARADQISETLILMVTTKPLDGLEPGPDNVPISSEQIKEWEKSWGTSVGYLEVEGGVGSQWTKAEKAAGIDPERLLRQGDAEPQTLYYRPNAKLEEPMMVKLHLRYRNPGKSTR